MRDRTANVVGGLTPEMVPYLTAEQLIDTFISTISRVARQTVLRDEPTRVMDNTAAQAVVLRRELLSRITAYEQGTPTPPPGERDGERG